MVKCVDDTLPWDDNIKGVFWHTFDYLTLCAHNGITFNPNKLMFAKTAVDFAGLTLAATFIKQCVDMMRAIQDFPLLLYITGT